MISSRKRPKTRQFRLSGKLYSQRRDSFKDLARSIALEGAGNREVDVYAAILGTGLVQVDFEQFSEVCLEGGLFLFLLPRGTHDGLKVDGCVTSQYVSYRQAFILLLHLRDDLRQAQFLAFDFPTVPESGLNLVGELDLLHSSWLTGLHDGHCPVEEHISMVLLLHLSE